MNDFAGGVGVAKRNGVHLASYLRDELATNNLICRPVTPFDQMIGSHQLNKVKRGIFVKRDDTIDAFQAGENRDSVI